MFAGVASSSGGPGKTPPRLLEDLLEYDPASISRNLLCEPAPLYDARTAPPRQKHKHELMLRPDRSFLPGDTDDKLKGSWTVVALCKLCRTHIEINVNNNDPNPYASVVCCRRENENPLHHLRYNTQRSQPIDPGYIMGNSGERWIDARVFSCTSVQCPTTVTITTKAPMLHDGFVSLLTDPRTLNQRLQKYLHQHPNYEDKQQRPDGALRTLQSYLSNTINKIERRPIPWENSRYMVTLSDECNDILRRAHFTKIEKDGAPHWAPPSEEQVIDANSPVSRDIRDLLGEVQILLDQHHQGEQGLTRRSTKLANEDIKRILCSEHEYVPKLSIDLTQPEHPFYANLGIVSDFTDNLVLWAYHRQRNCDPELAPYYLECLSGLATGRESEALQVEVATLRSQGEFSRSDILKAYKALNIDLRNKDEDHIIGVFKSRLIDAPMHEASMREQLGIIGKALKSPKIQQVARKAFSDVTGAYNWLGVTELTDDQFILSMYEVRVQDNRPDEPTAREALKAIAEARQSPILLTFLETGSIYEMPPDIDTAYTRLGVEDQTVPDEILINVFSFRLSDAPSQTQELRAALKVVGERRSSQRILEYLQTGQNTAPTRGSSESPVGLENIGNTCYLNSLLQYYFTIKPLREMVLDFHLYQEQEIDQTVIERKRVGGRKVAKSEIERAIKFANFLRNLFHDLIVTENSAVTPERDLAYLALVSLKDEAERRVSVSDGSGRPIIDLSNTDEDKMDIDPPGSISLDADDGASEATLVNEPQDDDHMLVDLGKSEPEDKENVPPVTNDSPGTLSPGRSPVIDVDMDAKGNQPESTVQGPLTPPPEMPDRAPPSIPPRPAARRNTVSSDINLMFGRQQDVTECIGNVMFQLEAALKPEKIDDNEEQIDLIKHLFYGKTKQTLSFPNSMESRTKEELFSHLLVNVAEGSRDLYSALDSSFDIEQVDLDGLEARRYLSVSEIPPVLQIQVQRVQFDREKGSAYKSNAFLQYPETLFMDRYMDNPDLKERREQTWRLKDELRSLLKRKDELTKTFVGVDVPKVLDTLTDFMEDIKDLQTEEDDLMTDSALPAALNRRSAAVRVALDTIKNETVALESKIKEAFTDKRNHGYRIHSVFIHRGSVSFGHYWIYIYDFQKGIWRKYNDQYVTEVVDPSEVFTHSVTDPQPPTPYFLVFVREDHLHITEAVKREIIQV